MTCLHLAAVALSAAAAPHCDATPKVVLAGSTTLVTLRVAGALQSGAEYTVRVIPMEWKGDSSVAGPSTLQVRCEEEALRFPWKFPAEQEYTVEVVSPDGKQRLATARLFAVGPDLFPLRPYKGDLHQHSNRSDGKEEPAYVAAFNRKIGMDFMALTDHRAYRPSLEAIEAFRGLPVDLQMYPGEEVHPPETMVHIVHFGGRASVNERFDQADYKEAVKKLAASLRDLPPGVDPQAYAACLWTFAEIRRLGGLSIFCHPYWVTGNRYNVPEAFIARLFAQRPFDAYEVIGGFWLNESEANALQVARYYYEAAAGRAVPVVGVSDGHGTARGLHGWYYTLVLARSPQFADVRDAILAERSLGVEQLPGAPAPRAFGPFRLVKYASFLMREVMPAHDALCAEEGEAMLAHVAGDPGAANRLKTLQGRVQALYRRMWATEGPQ
ncbi:MAG: hypothetical protein QHJ73_03560 [Armatimonadota bacterium]|nr:hypothetical protein [Armatimonadota bacterium]